MSKKEEYVDDGHTIYNMDIDGMPHSRVDTSKNLLVDKEDRKIIIKAALSRYMPVVLGMVGCFLLAALLLYLWLL